MRLSLPEKKIRVVVDANLVVSAALSIDSAPSGVFELILLELVENYTSREILDEIKDVFNRPKIRGRIAKEQIDFIIINFERFSKEIVPKTKLEVVKNDPADNKLFECAFESKADYVISGDKHVLSVGCFKEVKTLSPKEFLEILLSTRWKN